MFWIVFLGTFIVLEFALMAAQARSGLYAGSIGNLGVITAALALGFALLIAIITTSGG